MFPGLNQKKMAQMMKQLGIQQVDIPATEVIIKTETKEIIITNPSVAKVNMMGQETFQISGQIEEREQSVDISSDDIETVQQQAHVSAEEAKAALQETQGDLAKAILNLTSKS